MAALRSRLEAQPDLMRAVERHRGGESFEAVCVRFARARSASADAAFDMLKADLDHRNELVASGLLTASAANVLADGLRDTAGSCLGPQKGPRSISGGMDPEALLAAYCKFMPHALLGMDRQGRPVIYRAYTNSFSQLSKLGLDMETLIRYNQWTLEQCLEFMGHRGQWTVIVDFKGVGVSAFDTRGLQYTRLLMRQGADHYPERLGKAYLINAPSFFTFFWRWMKRWMDDKTREDVLLFTGPDEWRRPLNEVMDLRLLPEHLGGEAKLTSTGAVETIVEHDENDMTSGAEHWKARPNGSTGAHERQRQLRLPLLVMLAVVLLLLWCQWDSIFQVGAALRPAA